MPGQVEAPVRLDESWLDDPTVDGRGLYRLLRVTFDPSADASLRDTGAAYSLPRSRAGLPSGAIVVRSWYEVITTFISATDAATISIGYATDDVAGIVAAIAISNVGNPWDDGFKAGIQDGAVGNLSNKATAERLIDFTLGAAENLSAGKLVLYLQYVVSDAG